MGVLSNLQPQKVFYFFEEITKIPHGSGNVEQISDYLVQFAKERNLAVIQDVWKNVIIIKEATPGYENEPTVILQGHMDMVAVKKPDCDIDMKTQGLQVAIDGDFVYAKGTSLGGDDGIAVAYALAILDSDDLKHPRLEIVITVDEETGMDGAREIDLSMLKGNRLLNLDSEEEGIFLTSCAGGAKVTCTMNLAEQMMKGASYEVVIGGLQGGHSGVEIHKERGNSNILFGRLLWQVCSKMPVGIKCVSGGLADNAIPREAKAVFVIPKEKEELFLGIVETVTKDVVGELSTKDPGVYIEAKKAEEGSISCATCEDTRRMAAYLLSIPNGVQSMSADVEGLVETSLNLGILNYDVSDSGKMVAEFAVRSSVESAKMALLSRMEAVATLAGAESVVNGAYPGWKYRVESPLREKMITLYEKMYGEKPKVEAIHAGLECGLLGSKIKDLDCISFGPNMQNIHTTEETLSISSTARVWEYLVRLLEEKDSE